MSDQADWSSSQDQCAITFVAEDAFEAVKLQAIVLERALAFKRRCGDNCQVDIDLRGRDLRAALPGVTLRFGQSMDAVLFDPQVASQPIVGADEVLLHILEQHAQLLLEQSPGEDELYSRVEQAVAQSLHGGQPRVTQVARSLGMGERTLQRRLSERGLTFNDVVDQVRERLARQNVARDGVTLTEVAFLLGYSESSAFIRAFRRWTGETPRAYRKRALG